LAVEGHVLDDVRKEERRELLAEEEGDAGADPGELTPGERRDREPEGADLHDRQPAPPEELGDRAEGLAIGQALR
jgi:hypothetical protein